MKKNTKAVVKKTLIASAITSLMVGAAIAADTAYIGETGSVVVTGNTQTVANVTEAKGSTTKVDELSANDVVTLEGGSISVNYKPLDTTAAAAGSLQINSVDGNGTINLKGLNAATDTGFGATLTLSGQTDALGDVTLNFTSDGTGDHKGVATLSATANPLTLGVDKTDTEAAKTVAVNVSANTEAAITAGTNTLTLENVRVNNAGLLTFTGGSIALNSDFQNAASGTTVFAGNTTIGGETTTTVTNAAMIANPTAAQLGEFTEVFNDNVTIAAGGVLNAQNFTINNGTFDMKVASYTGPTKLNVSDTMTVTAGTHQFQGQVDISTLTIQAAAAETKIDVMNWSDVNIGALTLGGKTGAIGGFYVNGQASDSTVTIGTMDVGEFGAFGTWDGTTSVETMKVAGNSATASVNADAVMEIGDLTVGSNGSFTIKNGDVTIGALKVQEADSQANPAVAAGAFTMNGGTLTTAGANLLAYDADAGDTLAERLSLKEGLSFTGGVLKLTDSQFNGAPLLYTLSDWETIQDTLDTTNKLDLQFLNAELVARDADGNVSKASWNDAATVGYAGKSNIVIGYGSANPAVTTGSKAMTIGTIELKKNDPNSTLNAADLRLNIDFSTNAVGTNKLTIRGDDQGNVFFNVVDPDGKPLPVKVGNVNFGEEGADDHGVIDNAVTFYGTGDQGNHIYGDFEIKSVSVADNSSLEIHNRLVTDSIETATTSSTASVTGGTVVVKGSYLDAGNDKSLQVKTGGLTLNSRDNGDDTETGSLVVFGNYEANARALIGPEDSSNIVWFGEQTTLDKAVAAGTDESMDVIVDLNTLTKTDYTAQGANNTVNSIINVTADGQSIQTDYIYVNGLQNVTHQVLLHNEQTGIYSLALGDVSAPASSGSTEVEFGTLFYGNLNTDLIDADSSFDLYGYSTLANGQVDLIPNEDVLKAVKRLDLHSYAAIESAVRNVQFGQNGVADAVIFGLDDYINEIANSAATKEWRDTIAADTDAAAVAEAQEKLADYIVGRLQGLADVEHAVSNMAVLGGAFSTAFDINDQIRGTIDRRSSLANLNVARNATGITPWVDVMGTFNSADRLYGDTGYEADIYGATLGADWTASCGAILGAAISIGQADANSVDGATKVDNDVDFWGVSIYGSHRIGNVNGKFDLGYVSTSNDLSAHAFGRSFDESLDADIFTMGIGAEYIATVGSLNVVPHVGIRWSRLDMDDSKYGADYDTMNLFQAPVGVTFSGTFDMTGWKVAPMFDLSVVPAFGDKDAVANYAGGISDSVRVVDTNPIQATLGVNAQVGAWTFGVNYGLTAGGDERLNNSLNANARYTF